MLQSIMLIKVSWSRTEYSNSKPIISELIQDFWRYSWTGTISNNTDWLEELSVKQAQVYCEIKNESETFLYISFTYTKISLGQDETHSLRSCRNVTNAKIAVYTMMYSITKC